MKYFLDTSVFVAAARTSDQRYEPSSRILHQCSPAIAACAAHSLAEVYNSLTAMRPPNRFHPEVAIQYLDRMRAKVDCIVLTPEEVFDSARRIAGLGLLGGIIYDALLMACARKVDAERIYTWNVRHFQLVAPDIADRIVTP